MIPCIDSLRHEIPQVCQILSTKAKLNQRSRYTMRFISTTLMRSTSEKTDPIVNNEYDINNPDHHFMKLAIRHAQFAFREKEVPIGRHFYSIH